MAQQTYPRICKLASCQKRFTTKRKSQEYHSANCRVKAFNEAKMKAEYSRGISAGLEIAVMEVERLITVDPRQKLINAIRSFKPEEKATSDIGPGMTGPGYGWPIKEKP